MPHSHVRNHIFLFQSKRPKHRTADITLESPRLLQIPLVVVLRDRKATVQGHSASASGTIAYSIAEKT